MAVKGISMILQQLAVAEKRLTEAQANLDRVKELVLKAHE